MLWRMGVQAPNNEITIAVQSHNFDIFFPKHN